MSVNEGDVGASAPAETTTGAPETSASETQTAQGNNAQAVDTNWQFDDSEIPASVGSNFVNQYASIAKELGMNKETAHKMLSRAVEVAERLDQETIEQQTQEWVKELRNDPVLGGVNFKQNLSIAKRGVLAYDKTGEFMNYLEASGLGNNPMVIRFLYAVGRDVGEDGFIQGGQTSNKPQTFQQLADKLYGTVG